MVDSNQQRRAKLRAWVARLNVDQEQREDWARTRRIDELLDEFDREQKGCVDDDELRRRFDAWLETAGEIGGPEQEQDPTRAHPRAWHGHRHDDEV